MKMDVKDLGNSIKQVSLEGRMDVQGALQIDTQFAEIAKENRYVLLDLSGVSFLASLGIRTLVAGAKALSQNNGNLVVISPQEAVANVLKSTGIDSVIPIKNSLAEALALVGR